MLREAGECADDDKDVPGAVAKTGGDIKAIVLPDLPPQPEAPRLNGEAGTAKSHAEEVKAEAVGLELEAVIDRRGMADPRLGTSSYNGPNRKSQRPPTIHPENRGPLSKKEKERMIKEYGDELEQKRQAANRASSSAMAVVTSDDPALADERMKASLTALAATVAESKAATTTLQQRSADVPHSSTNMSDAEAIATIVKVRRRPRINATKLLKRLIDTGYSTCNFLYPVRRKLRHFSP